MVSTNARVLNNSRDILFHPYISSGTGAARGDLELKPNFHYYWEIKMLTMLYGTDVMVGVGTSDVVLNNWKYKACSMLGIDSSSWGYSYRGIIQHDNVRKRYGSKFGFGSIIGVHLDMCNGTLEYYLNKKPLGIAFTGLKQFKLYPLVSSTAAQSAMRISRTYAEKPTLQMLALVVICEHSALYKVYEEIPGLYKLYESKYSWIVPKTDAEQKYRETKEDKPVAYKSHLRGSCCVFHHIPQQYTHGCHNPNFTTGGMNMAHRHRDYSAPV
ncbi:unnamed protein product [Acanthoscelides obtectus]|nr:unnamed protein product [Acanthoscelides obtectus]CAK1647363.1 SPRY domain-containing SOCS box protein 3 [Acanthoscelides obtectus]